jgi:hypothetical protein
MLSPTTRPSTALETCRFLLGQAVVDDCNDIFYIQPLKYASAMKYKGEKGILSDRGGTFRCIQDFAHAIRIAEVIKDLGQILF